MMAAAFSSRIELTAKASGVIPAGGAENACATCPADVTFENPGRFKKRCRGSEGGRKKKATCECDVTAHKINAVGIQACRKVDNATSELLQLGPPCRLARKGVAALCGLCRIVHQPGVISEEDDIVAFELSELGCVI